MKHREIINETIEQFRKEMEKLTQSLNRAISTLEAIKNYTDEPDSSNLAEITLKTIESIQKGK